MPEWKPDQRFQDALEEGVEYIKRKLGDLNYHQVIVIICAPTDASPVSMLLNADPMSPLFTFAVCQEVAESINHKMGEEIRHEMMGRAADLLGDMVKAEDERRQKAREAKNN